MNISCFQNSGGEGELTSVCSFCWNRVMCMMPHCRVRCSKGCSLEKPRGSRFHLEKREGGGERRKERGERVSACSTWAGGWGQVFVAPTTSVTFVS